MSQINQEISDIEQYVLEQAKVEIEHTRSWPNKILAFYVALNIGLVTILFALTSQRVSVYVCTCWFKSILTNAAFITFVWILFLLMKNHKSYLAYRQIQVQFQKARKTDMRGFSSLPPEWFADIDVKLSTRWQGWGFYAVIVCFVFFLSLVGIWAR